ncbi:MAG: mannose-6-phosphate isomerase [Bacteroidetes bacterium GWA2_30_7]|nr:MAG: mannose-6-phosphate isomerase [Bacteroidetes bacterium GWA2_30_7]
MNHLYPFKFEPIIKDKIWGGNKLKTILNKHEATDKSGESWEISSIEENISVVSNGFLEGNDLQEIIEIYMGDIVGEKVFEKYGVEFPLLIKFIDATDDLSIQVHPDNELAKKRHNAYGKTEMWYVVQAEKDSQLISGFNQEINQEILNESINNNTLIKYLNHENVKKGDVFFLPAGRIHAIKKGILLAEIQQTSDITYRLFDWNRPDEHGNFRELHVDLALDAIDYKLIENYKTSYNLINDFSSEIIKTEFFTTNIINLTKSINLNYSLLDSFVILMCLEGSFSIIDDNNLTTIVNMGETVLIPAVLENINLITDSCAKLLEVYIDLK